MLESCADEHLTAEHVYKKLLERGEEIGLATVYRVLTQFESAGLVNRHHFESAQSFYELDSGRHHDHIVCRDCGRVVEFMDEVIEERQRKLAEGRGFDILDHSLVIYGTCRDPGCEHKK